MLNEEFDACIKYMNDISPDWASGDKIPPYYYTSKIDVILERYNRINNDSFSEKYRSGFKKISYQEMLMEELNDFSPLRKKYTDIFATKLQEKIGNKKVDVYNEFVHAWCFNGKNDPLVQRFRNIILKYLNSRSSNFYCEEKPSETVEYLYNNSDVKDILDLQFSLLSEIESEVSPEHHEYGENIPSFHFFFRGLNMKEDQFTKSYQSKKMYYDKELISSYTNSIIIAELFSEINREKNTRNEDMKKIILAIPYSQIDTRILANPLLNKELPLEQFEFVTIPSFIGYFINYKGDLNGKINYAIEKKYELFDNSFDTYLAYGENKV